ncbi:hypothetical protein COCNU_06G013340 [Cocos nucifera]|uniref:ACT-like domain-containing protein n=1 Tax=Cocos nucifera TaxID=13894 RepID=A0A8K0ICK4_COCNU|nr:hypothetical protein COCNU_06G013340 [Cocos nucifera]
MESLAFARPSRVGLQFPVRSPPPSAVCSRPFLLARHAHPAAAGGKGPFLTAAAIASSSSAAITSQPDLASSPPPTLPLKRVTADSLQYESGYLGGISERTAAPAVEGGRDGVLNPMEYLTNILSSRVYDVAIESPLQLAPKLSERLGVDLWLKREDLQPDMFEEKRSILEPAGALSLAGAEAYCKYYGLKGTGVVAITSGANMNFDRLRLVTELADVGRKREAVLATILREERGSFKQFCELVGSINITEFKYRYDSHKEDALVLYRQVGGRSNVQDELLCRFIFPERPGALMKFLDAFSPRWNISLFHYRAQGDTGANVLVGIQVPKEDMEEFTKQANHLGYEYTYEGLVPGVMIFGDSVVDAGNNNNRLTLVKANFPPYGRDFVNHIPTGRFCNGKLATDFTVENLGFTSYPPAYLSEHATGKNLLSGANFASGASGYLDGTSTLYGAISLNQQLRNYQDYQSKVERIAGRANATALFSGSIYVVSAGASDFVQNYYINPVVNRAYTPDRFADLVVQNFNTFIEALYNSGARRIGVTSLPPLGCLPAAITLFGGGSNDCVIRLNNDAMVFNKKLNAAGQTLRKSHPGLKLVVFDIYNPLLDLIRHPENNGSSCILYFR